ncbi:MAG: type I-F CRISPR-associated endoribonuclease Cas6/Csy4 [Formosimonas sp.]
MKHYIEITLIPQTEISLYFIWSKLYTQIHLALVSSKDANDRVSVGVGFPEYRYEETKGGVLGSKLRLFAVDEVTLEQLNVRQCLARLQDYVHISSVREVPQNKVTGYLTVNRYRPPANPDKLTRRFAKRKHLTDWDTAKNQQIEAYAHRHQQSIEEAQKNWAGVHLKRKNLPYVVMKSLSGSQTFSLMIEQKVVEQALIGQFSTYGLSSEATVPQF